MAGAIVLPKGGAIVDPIVYPGEHQDGCLITCWTWRQHDSCHCLLSIGDLKEQVYWERRLAGKPELTMADPAPNYIR